MSKVILVIGAAGGVGSSVVREFLGKGYQVVGTVLNSQEAESVRAQSPDIKDIIEMDLGDATSVADTLQTYLQSMDGGLYGVVVCAAISPYGPVETSSIDKLRRTLEINTLSGVAIYQATIAHLRQTKGRLIYISSMAGRVGMAFLGWYTTSKFALEGAVEVMRCEAAAWGVKVILIEPGGIQTSMVSNQIADLDRDIAALEGNERELYIDLYKGFQAMARDSYQKGSLKPQAVGERVWQVFDTPRPWARYKIGTDSKAICLLSWLLPRHWIEALLAKAMQSAAKK